MDIPESAAQAPILPGTPSIQHPTPNDPPWNSWVAIGLWVISILLIFFLPAIFVLPYLATSGVFSLPQAEAAKFAATDPKSIIIQMLAIVPTHIFTLLFAWLIVTRRNRFSFRETLGFKSGGIRWWHYIALFVVFFALAALVGSYFPEKENELLRVLQSSRAAVFVVAFMATFTAPLIEEVVYRGVLYSAFQRSMGAAAAVVVVTLMFTLVHVPQYYESPATLVLLLILSMALTGMRFYSNNLLPCIIFHTIVNGVQSVALILEPHLKQASDANTVSSLFK